MNYNQVLDQLEVQSGLNLNPSPKDANWMSHWIDETRVSISLHKETIAKLKEDKLKVDTLGIQTEERTSSKSGKPYTSHRIVIYKPSEDTLGRM
jgi:hypothetical protein